MASQSSNLDFRLQSRDGASCHHSNQVSTFHSSNIITLDHWETVVEVNSSTGLAFMPHVINIPEGEVLLRVADVLPYVKADLKKIAVRVIEKLRISVSVSRASMIFIFLLEKAMTEKAFELHAELGNATSELPVTEQEQQLKVIEEDTQLFVSTKATATEQLKAQLRGLKSMYGSSIKHLDDLAEELEGKSQLAFDNLNLEISNHSTFLMNVSSISRLNSWLEEEVKTWAVVIRNDPKIEDKSLLG
ncbi:hypothetical protein HYC85_024287 [Camellia sinensis]|uniref:Uncharacterized protein n=1 Tax=Camellia sinensis TaxID=4442 RepID=A0A7J7GA14_CAMSI|nr:hypothetical protein HYC85_024287 [Camellia sinensis]